MNEKATIDKIGKKVIVEITTTQELSTNQINIELGFIEKDIIETTNRLNHLIELKKKYNDWNKELK